jgi:hypothetical protein
MRASIPFSLSLIALLLACEDRPPTLAPEGASADKAPVLASAATASEIAKLRRLVAPFHNFHNAVAAGWTVPFTPCLEEPGVGGMGFHYGNPAFVEDGGTVELLEPELLLYEPQKNGKLRFVGVEYIVPFADVPATDPPPTLLGQEFAQVPDAGLWGLHIWVGRNNPSGIFASWNPKVSCKYAGLQEEAPAHSH